MKKLLIFPIFIISLISCNSGDKGDYTDESIMTPGQNNGAAKTQDNTGVTITGGNEVAPVAIDAQNMTATAAAGVRLNPKHGEPGHRCDIAEGAPLDSKPTGAANVNTTTINPTAVTPTITPVTTTAPAKKTAPGMNPPHGQPGHRCDIAEGAPLDSKPAAVKTEATPVQVTPVEITPGAIKAEDAKSSTDAVQEAPVKAPNK